MFVISEAGEDGGVEGGGKEAGGEEAEEAYAGVGELGGLGRCLWRDGGVARFPMRGLARGWLVFCLEVSCERGDARFPRCERLRGRLDGAVVLE